MAGYGTYLSPVEHHFIYLEATAIILFSRCMRHGARIAKDWSQFGHT